MPNASLLLGFIAFLMSTPVNTVEAESLSASTPAEALVTPSADSSVLEDCSVPKDLNPVASSLPFPVSAPAHSASAVASVPVVFAAAGFSAEDLVSPSCLDSVTPTDLSAPAEASASEDGNVVSSASPLPVSAPSAASASPLVFPTSKHVCPVSTALFSTTLACSARPVLLRYQLCR